MMLDNNTVWGQVLSQPTEDNPNLPEWQWDGYSALDGSQKIGMKLDTDFELFYDLQGGDSTMKSLQGSPQ